MTNLKRIAAFTLISGGIALGTLAVAESATASPLNIVDNGDGTATGYWQLPATGTWPQTAINPAVLCGVVQADRYPYATAADKARTDALTADSTLTEGEDYGWPTSWMIKEYPACATPGTVSPTPSPTLPTTTPTSSTVPTPPSPTGTPTPITTTPPVKTATPSPVPPVVTPQPTATTTSPAAVPATSPTPMATSTSTSTPAAAASNRNGTGTIAEQTNGSTELAYTGSNTGPAIGGAVALLIGGLVMLALGRRNRNAN